MFAPIIFLFKALLRWGFGVYREGQREKVKRKRSEGKGQRRRVEYGNPQNLIPNPQLLPKTYPPSKTRPSIFPRSYQTNEFEHVGIDRFVSGKQ